MGFYHCRSSYPLSQYQFLNTGLAKFQHVFTTVVTSIRGEFVRLYANTSFCLSQYRKRFSSVTGVTPVNLIVKDDSGTVLHQLQRVTKGLLSPLIRSPSPVDPGADRTPLRRVQQLRIGKSSSTFCSSSSNSYHGGINKTIAKTHLLSYGPTHVLHIIPDQTQEKLYLFSEN